MFSFFNKIFKKNDAPDSQQQPEQTLEQAVEDMVEEAGDTVENLSHAVEDKAEELEMRAEILADEAVQTVKEWADDADKLADAVSDKLDELEIRAEIVAEEVAQTVKESLHIIETSIVDELPKVQIMSEESETPPATDNEPDLSWAERLKQGLSKSRNHMAKSLASVFGGGKIDDDLYEELETVLITSDMGIEATEQLMNEVRKRVSLKGLKDGNELRQALKDAVYDLLKPTFDTA